MGDDKMEDNLNGRPSNTMLLQTTGNLHKYNTCPELGIAPALFKIFSENIFLETLHTSYFILIRSLKIKVSTYSNIRVL